MAKRRNRRATRSSADDGVRVRNRRADEILAANPDGVLEAAMRVDVTRRLATMGAPAALLGALVQAATAPAAWRALAVWQWGANGLQAMIPHVRVERQDISVLVRAGDPEWTGARRRPAGGGGVELAAVTAGEVVVGKSAGGRTLAAVVGEWLGVAPAGGGLSLLTVVVEAGGLVGAVGASMRLDPILPRITVSASGPERARGARLLGGLVPALDPETLPLFPDARPEPLRVPLLELADASGVRSMARGRGAPLDLRLVVEAVLGVWMEARVDAAVRIVWTVGELLAALEPAHPRGGILAAWGRVRAAVVSAGERWIPWLDGGRWWLLRVRGEPGERPAMTDPVVVEVAIPPGSAAGPKVDRAALRRAGLRSAPAYRTLIGVQSVTWIPGRTRIPLPGIGGVWTGDARRYPVLTAADRRRIAFGAESTHKPHRVDAAYRDTAGVVVLDTEAVDLDGRRGWRVVPEAAAEAIRKARQPFP